jgi:hypothetical protein
VLKAQVSGSIRYEMIGFFNRPNPFSCTVVLGSSQPLTEMSTRNFWGVMGFWRLSLTAPKNVGAFNVSKPSWIA